MKLDNITDFKKIEGRLKDSYKTLYLNPRKTEKELSITESKMGGAPNLAKIKEWPVCEYCNANLNFILQLYKKDFPLFYFPEGENLFLLFRCPNPGCPDAFSEKHDHSMSWFYLNANDSSSEKPIHHPNQSDKEDWEKPIPICSFNPQEKIDYPNSYEERVKLCGSIYDTFSDKYLEDEFIYNEFLERYPNWYGTKIGGYPSWTQNYYDFRCQCKENKRLLFQLSTCYGLRFPEDKTEFEDHGISIGDAGNIYFFICDDCGEESIETYWDCE